jgi:hypothetical protein
MIAIPIFCKSIHKTFLQMFLKYYDEKLVRISFLDFLRKC